MSNLPIRSRRWLLVPVVSGTTVLALAACSGGGSSAGASDTQAPPPSTTAQSSPSTMSSPSSPTGTTTSSSRAGSSAKGTSTNAALLRAGATAEDRVKNSTLISIETEGNGTRWEVQVVTPDGTEHELDVSKNGSKVLTGPTTEHEHSHDRAKHQRRVQAAKLDYRQAATKAAGAVKDGEITELDLDTYHGKTVWESDVMTPSGTKHEVKIDAKTGEVIANRASSG